MRQDAKITRLQTKRDEYRGYCHHYPLLRESAVDESDIDLNHVILKRYRLSKIRQQDLRIDEDPEQYRLEPGDGGGTGKPHDPQEEFLSQIIERLNEIFLTDELTDKDLVNYAHTIRDKVVENERVMSQISNNTAEQAMLGDFTKAVDDAVLDSNDAQQNQMLQLLSDPAKANGFAKIVFDLIKLSVDGSTGGGHVER